MRAWTLAVLAPILAACGGASGTPAANPVTPAPSSSTAGDEAASSDELVCPLSVPEDVSAHASILKIPQDLFDRALTPVVSAVCKCAAHGQNVALAVRILPEAGEVRATTADDPRVDACLHKLLDPGRFDRFEVAAGSGDAERPVPQQALDPNRPGRLAAFHQGPPPPPKPAPPQAQPQPKVIALALTFGRP
jgi:hypothetical protein